MLILVVEDELKIALFLERGLREQGHVVQVASDGEAGLRLSLQTDFDLIVLDVLLPKIDGIEVCRRLRTAGRSCQIIMLTARSDVQDRIAGLDAGADDYLTKPFAFDELLARIRVLQRGRAHGSDKLSIGEMTLDTAKRRVERGGVEIELSNKEYALLEYLMRNHDRVVTRTMIAEHVWNVDFDTLTNVIDVYVNYLRRKIDDGFGEKLIRTLRGRGYMLSSNQSTSAKT